MLNLTLCHGDILRVEVNNSTINGNECLASCLDWLTPKETAPDNPWSDGHRAAGN
jgi:hypothetical protein